MAILSAQALKQREMPEFTVDIGDGDEVRVSRPDLETLIMAGVLPLPLLGSVATMVEQYAGTKLDETNVDEQLMRKSVEARQFVDRWVCASMLEPRCVLTRDEIQPGDTGTICIDDLRFNTRVLIFNAVFGYRAAEREAARRAAEEFRQLKPGEGSGQDVPTVPPATVDSPAA